MKLRLITGLAVLSGAALLYGGWLAWRAHLDLVTLNVRNMDVRRVVKKMERQTWETILVHSNVQGSVTLNVRRMPLDQVLRIIAQQTSSRWEKLYPLYSKSRSLAMLERGLLGEIDPAEHGWTNLQSRPFFRGGPGGPFGGPLGMPNEASPKEISLSIVNKELSFATLALNRFAQLRVVPEDGTFPMVSVILRNATSAKAVKVLAKKVHRSWTKLYAFTRDFGPGGPGGPSGGRGFAGGPPPTQDPNAPPRRRFDMTPEGRDEARKKQQDLEAELLTALPTQQRERLQQAQQEREQQFQEMQNLTPEERRARFAQGPRGGMDRMFRDRIKNSTQEQRVEQTRRMLAMRERMQLTGAPPPPGR